MEHKCPAIDKLNFECPTKTISVKHYELGGWEVERKEPWDEPSSVDEIYFCPYCGANLEDELKWSTCCG